MENDDGGVGLFNTRFEVRLLSSSAIINPETVTIIAVVFRYHGMVIIWVVVGGMLWEMKKPAKILPNANRLIGFINFGSFSLIIIVGGNRGLVIETK